jgi:hypothetical protein
MEVLIRITSGLLIAIAILFIVNLIISFYVAIRMRTDERAFIWGVEYTLEKRKRLIRLSKVISKLFVALFLLLVIELLFKFVLL